MQELRWEQSFGNMKVELSRKLVDSQMKIFQIDMITGNMKEKKKEMPRNYTCGNSHLRNKMSHKVIFLWGKNVRKKLRFYSIKGS